MAKGDSYAASQLFMGLTPKNGYKASKLYCYKPTDGSGDFTWARNINSYRLNQSGLLELMGNNVPRIDYTNTCPELLIEGERENLLTYSEQFNNAYWINSNITITPNAISAPNNTLTADLILEDNTTASHGLASGLINFISGITYSLSFYVKNITNGRGFFQIAFFQITAGNNNAYVNFDIQNGQVTFESNAVGKIENVGNGFYRCSLIVTSGKTYTERANARLITNGNANAFENYLGNTSKGIYIWGAQLEEGSYPTSYIPTTTASVTRPQDTNSSDIAFTGDGFSYNLRVRLENTGVVGVPDNIFFISDLAGEIYAGIYVLGDNFTFTFYNIPDLEEYTIALADGVHNIGVSLDCTTGAYEIVIDGVSQFSGTLSIGYSAATDYTTVKLGCLVGSTDSIGLNRIIGLQVYDAVLTQGELIEYTS
jgi:hypothetical protein